MVIFTLKFIIMKSITVLEKLLDKIDTEMQEMKSFEAFSLSDLFTQRRELITAVQNKTISVEDFLKQAKVLESQEKKYFNYTKDYLNNLNHYNCLKNEKEILQESLKKMYAYNNRNH